MNNFYCSKLNISSFYMENVISPKHSGVFSDKYKFFFKLKN